MEGRTPSHDPAPVPWDSRFALERVCIAFRRFHQILFVCGEADWAGRGDSAGMESTGFGGLKTLMYLAWRCMAEQGGRGVEGGVQG